MDNEIKGEGNSYAFTYRMHDPRVGRFFSVDPLIHKYPWYSSYSFAGNKVTYAIDIEGLEEYVVTTNRDWRLRMYKVLPGDNLTVISQTTGVSVDDILKYNSFIEDPDKIYPEQHLFLRDASGLTMADFEQPKKSNWAKEFIVELATTNENGPSVQSQAETVMEVEMAATGINLLRNAPKAIRGVAKRIKGKAYTPKVQEGITAKDKSPQIGAEFESYSVKIDGGKINIGDRAVTNGTFDFVITNNGKLQVGKGHYNLSNGAETVQAAGQIKVYKGKITTINNSSGHYKPSLSEGGSFGNALKGQGLDVSGAKLKLYNSEGALEKTVIIE